MDSMDTTVMFSRSDHVVDPFAEGGLRGQGRVCKPSAAQPQVPVAATGRRQPVSSTKAPTFID
jgi:hypothetical protein